MAIDPRSFDRPTFQAAMLGLLPTGAIWPRSPLALLAAVSGAISDSECDIEQIAADLLMVESFPETADQLLSDWEQEYGLPDPCTPLAPTIAQRQAALLTKIAATGGQSIPYFEGIAAVYGYPGTTITEYRPFRAGLSAPPAPIYSVPMIYTWTINVPVPGPDSQFECIMNRLKPAYTRVFFSYA